MTRGVVVVGVDGSRGALAAIRWAAVEARLRRTSLRVVHAYTYTFPTAGGGGYGNPYVGGSTEALLSAGPNDLHQAAEELLEKVIADVAADVEGLEIERRVVAGAAVEVLIHAVAEHDLLVVGSRGHGGFAGLLLGSVSAQCAHLAPCPVVIVRPAEQRPAGRAGRLARSDSDVAA